MEPLVKDELLQKFCEEKCKGCPPRSTCTSLGTCKEYDKYCTKLIDEALMKNLDFIKLVELVRKVASLTKESQNYIDRIKLLSNKVVLDYNCSHKWLEDKVNKIVNLNG